jgi:hypothetical protein
MLRTVVDDQLIRPQPQRVVIVPCGELAEGGQAGCPHPYLERFPGVEIWQSGLAVAIRVCIHPVGRRDDIFRLVRRFFVQIALRAPADPVLCHIIEGWLVAIVLSLSVENCQIVVRVVEHGIGNEAAGIVWLAARPELQRIAVSSIDGSAAYSLSLQLVKVERFDVPTVILIEIRQAIVEIDWGFDIVRYLERQNTDVRLQGGPIRCPRPVALSLAPLRLCDGGSFESVRYFVVRYISQIFRSGLAKVGLRCVGEALGVVYGNLLDLDAQEPSASLPTAEHGHILLLVNLHRAAGRQWAQR